MIKKNRNYYLYTIKIRVSIISPAEVGKSKKQVEVLMSISLGVYGGNEALMTSLGKSKVIPSLLEFTYRGPPLLVSLPLFPFHTFKNLQ